MFQTVWSLSVSRLIPKIDFTGLAARKAGGECWWKNGPSYTMELLQLNS